MRLGSRLLGALVAIATLGFPVWALCFDWRLGGGRYAAVAYGLIALGGLLSFANCYLSWVRPVLHKWRAKPGDDYRFVSGIPMFGMLTLPGLLLAPASTWLSALVLLAVLADTGNALWFVIATWADETFWNPEPRS